MSRRWHILAASTTGGAHARAGLSSQDAFAVDEVDGALVVAVADGAGSAPLAAAGASLAVSLARRALAAPWRDSPDTVERLRDPDPSNAAVWRDYLDRASDRAVRHFRRAAAAVARTDRRLHAGDLGTTLTVVVASPPWIGLFAVGDGFVVLRTADGHHDLLFSPPGGADRPPGATTLLTSARVGNTARRVIARVPDLTGLAVGSDGLDTLLIEYVDAHAVRPHAALFERLFMLAGNPETDAMHLTQTLAGKQVCERTDDDRTLVLAVPR
jgi:hypothetical protein